MPFNTSISFELYDPAGRTVKRIMNTYKRKGRYFIKMDVSDVSSGVYFLNAKGNGFFAVRKIIIKR